MSLATREANEADYPLIADSFWRVARSVPACYGAGRKFLVGMLDRVIADPSWNVVVLYETDVPDETIGWAIHRSTDELFFIAIKPRYQRLGMAKRLIELSDIDPSHSPITVPFSSLPLLGLIRSVGSSVRIRPYMALV